jgi:hypothetical protein
MPVQDGAMGDRKGREGVTATGDWGGGERGGGGINSVVGRVAAALDD